MSSNYVLLDVPVEETNGDENVTYVFQKDNHATILLKNLAEMQAHDGLLTDVSVSTGTSEDREEKFHSILLAACSPKVKRFLVTRSVKGTRGSIVLIELTKELLEIFKAFIYKSDVTWTLEEDILDDLDNFAVKYDIDLLAAMCRNLQEIRNPMRFVFSDHADVLAELFDMFMAKELTTTVLEDEKGMTPFAVHGPLIAAASPALRQALLQGCSARERKKLRLDIPSVSLGDFIGYIYSAKVTLQRENVIGLLRAACIYQMPALAKVCCDWLIPRLDTFDVVSILCLAQEPDSGYTEDLKEESKSNIIANFSKLSTEDEFNELGYENLKEIIQDNELDIESEEDVFGVVMRWIECDEETRLPHLSELLSCVRLEKTSVAFLRKVKQDPRIGKSSRCLHVIEVARQKLAAADDDEGFQEVEGTLDDSSLPELSEDAAQRDCPPDSYSRDSYSRDSYSRDNYQPDSSSHDSYPRDSSQCDSYQPDSYSRDSYSRDSYQPESYPRDSYQPESYPRDSHQPDSYQSDSYGPPDNYQLDSYPRDSYPRDSSQCDSYQPASYQPESYPPDCYQPDSYPHDSYLCDSYQPGKPRSRNDGQPDMRCKENRELYLDKGVNVNGSPDKRMRENREKFTGPLKKDGSPDMRFKVNKELFGRKGRNKASPPINRQRKVGNRETSASSCTTSDACTSVSGGRSVGESFFWDLPLPSGYIGGPLKKNGTPDMRYKVNKQQTSAAATGASCGPLKKNGTPDMRYAVNKQSHNPRPPAPSSKVRGPLKKDGTPDMRFKANKR